MTESPAAPAGYYFDLERITDPPLRLPECSRRKHAVQQVLEVDALLVKTAEARPGTTSVRRGLLFLALLCPEELVPCWQSKGRTGGQLKVSDMVKAIVEFVESDANCALVQGMGLKSEPQRTGYYPKYIQQLLQRSPSGRRDGAKFDGRAGPVALVALNALYPFHEDEQAHLAPIVRAFDTYIQTASGGGTAAKVSPFLARLDDVSFAVLGSLKADLPRWLRAEAARPRPSATRAWLEEIEQGCSRDGLAHVKKSALNRAVSAMVEEMAFCLYVASGYSRDDPRGLRIEGDLEQAILRTRHQFFSRQHAATTRPVPAPPLSVVRALLATFDGHIFTLIERWRAADVQGDAPTEAPTLDFSVRGYGLATNLLNLRAALDSLPPIVEDWPILRKSMRDVFRPIA